MTDHELRRVLTDLCELRADAEPVVTLYLDTHWADEKQRERSRVFVQEAIKRAVDRHSEHPRLDALRRTLGRVAAEAAERHSRPDGAARGLAVFACGTPRLWRVLPVPRPFRDELCVDSRPHLLQLARLAEDVEPAVIALVHDRGAQVYEVALGGIVSEAAVERPAARAPGEGGRGRAGVGEARAEELLGRVRREGALLLRQVWERDPRAHVVLVGTDEKVAAFERLLPERMQARVLARLPRPPGGAAGNGQGRHALVESVVQRLLEGERRREAEHVERAIGEAMRGGLAVLGPEDVVLAVNERRVQHLILEDDFERSGWRCRSCGALGTNHDEVCSFCQGPLARVDALGEELACRVLSTDGEVEVVGHSQRLHAYAGVAALLRQARAVGLAGTPRPQPAG